VSLLLLLLVVAALLLACLPLQEDANRCANQEKSRGN
jgi:hypothetical protein